MKELFIVEADTKGFSVHRSIALLAAVVFALVFTGCTFDRKVYVDRTKPWAEINFSIDKSSRYAPTFAVWVKDEETGDASTLAATQKAAKNQYTGGQARPEALPVWSQARKTAGEDDTDAISSATPSGSAATLNVQIPEKFKGRKIIFYIEANTSYDYNGYYSQDAKSGDAGYSGVNGQPSVVWKAEADTSANPSGTLKPEIIGHGDVSGASGDVDADMSNVTTAASIFGNIEIQYDMGK